MKYCICLVVLFCLAVVRLLAQSNDFRYVYGGGRDDFGRALATVGQNQLFIFGHSNSNSPVNQNRAALLKIDSSGRQIFSREYGLISDGYEMGSYGAHRLFILGNDRTANVGSVFIAIVDTNGNVVRQNHITNGLSLNWRPLSAAVLPDKGFLLACLEDGSLKTTMVRADSLGQLIWAKSTPAQIHQITDVELTRDGNILITGNYDNRIYLQKLDINGNSIWSRRVRVNDQLNVVNSVKELPDGNIVTHGYFFNGGARDNQYCKFRADGTPIWCRGYDMENDVGIGMTLDLDGNALTTGYIFTDPATPDLTVIKMDTSGAVMWSKRLSGANSDWVVNGPRHILPLGRNKYFMIGSSSSSEGGASGYDYVAFRFRQSANLGCFAPVGNITRTNYPFTLNENTATDYIDEPLYRNISKSLQINQPSLCRKIACEPTRAIFDTIRRTGSSCADSVTLDAGNPGSTYLWSTGQLTQSIKVTASGTYRVTLISTCGSFTDDIRITVPPPQNLLPPTISVLDTLCPANQVRLRASTQTGNALLWNTGDTTRTITIDTSGVYSAMAIRGGCISPASNSVLVQVDSACTDSLLVIPNLITPNADGFNDRLRIPSLSLYPGNQIWIYNRWGILLLNEAPYRGNWPPADVPTGTYFIWLEIPELQDFMYKGWLEVGR